MEHNYLHTFRLTVEGLPEPLEFGMFHELDDVAEVTDGYCTVTGGLVAARVSPSFRNSRNSYVPAVAGAAIVHVRAVTPAPT